MVFSVVVLLLKYYYVCLRRILMLFIEEFAKLRICLFRYVFWRNLAKLVIKFRTIFTLLLRCQRWSS